MERIFVFAIDVHVDLEITCNMRGSITHRAPSDSLEEIACHMSAY
jgi:hypothetical protein